MFFSLFQPDKLADFVVGPNGRKLKIDFDHGTTTLGFMYQGGIVLAVDSRATGGNYIGNLADILTCLVYHTCKNNFLFNLSGFVIKMCG